MTIRVISFDFDGCLFNETYCLDKRIDKSIIAYNIKLLDKLREERSSFSKVITLVGSNRQSKDIDAAAQYIPSVDDENYDKLPLKGSCFPEMPLLSEYLNATFDSFLIADVESNLPNGTSYTRAMDEDYKGEHGFCTVDQTKLTMIYAQVHKIALENPDEDIIFDLYDDKGKQCRSDGDDLLEHLYQFFTQNPDMLPNNVTLRLNHYAGEEVTAFEPIKGKGVTDQNYPQTVSNIIKITNEKQLPYIQEEVEQKLIELAQAQDEIAQALVDLAPQYDVLAEEQTALQTREASLHEQETLAQQQQELAQEQEYLIQTQLKLAQKQQELSELKTELAQEKQAQEQEKLRGETFEQAPLRPQLFPIKAACFVDPTMLRARTIKPQKEQAARAGLMESAIALDLLTFKRQPTGETPPASPSQVAIAFSGGLSIGADQ